MTDNIEEEFMVNTTKGTDNQISDDCHSKEFAAKARVDKVSDNLVRALRNHMDDVISRNADTHKAWALENDLL